MDLDHDFEKSDEQWEQSRNAAAIQTAADTMIALTESYRHYFRQRHGGDSVPEPPKPTHTHSRTFSGSSILSRSVSDDESSMESNLDPVLRGQISSFPYYNTSVPDILAPGFPRMTESQPLLTSGLSNPEPTMADSRSMALLNRASHPNIALRPDSPRPPPLRFSHPGATAPKDSRRAVPPTTSTRHFSHTRRISRRDSVYGARRQDTSRTDSYQSTMLGTDSRASTQQLGDIVHVRTGSDDLLLCKEVRRKPLAPGARTIEFNHTFTNEILFVAVICLAQVLSLAGFAQALIPARIIGEAFPEHTSGHIAWYSASYTLTMGVFVLPAARLGTIFGNKRIFVVGYAWFSIWSLVAGLCIYVQKHTGRGTAYFCFCRAMQGIGPALLIPSGQAMLQRAYPPGKRKSLAMGLFDASAPVGFVIGALVASLFTGLSDWPWTFYSLATVCLALASSSILIIPRQNVMFHKLDGSLWERLDGPALLCWVVGFGLFSAGWNQASAVSLDAIYTCILVIVGAVIIAPFIYLELKARRPLVPFKRIQASAGIVLACTTAGWAAFGGWLWYLVQVLEGQRGWTALRLAAGFTPLLVTGALASFLYNSILTRLHRPQWTMVLSSVALAIGSVLMATTPEKQSYWFNTFFSILIMPLGMVLSTPAAIALLADGLPAGHQGLASGLAATTMGYGISLGLGMAGAVEAQVRKRGGGSFEGYRAAQYFSVGVGGLSALLALALLAVSYYRR